MKYYTNEYPSFENIKNNLSKNDLIDIIEQTIDYGDSVIETIVKDFIEANYEPIKVRDVDRERDEMIDEEMRNES